MKHSLKIALALVIGFAAAMLLMSICIFFGYTAAYRSGVQSSAVRLLGIPIYLLTRSGNVYLGQSQGIYMGAVCGICMVLSVATEEIICHIKQKRS